MNFDDFVGLPFAEKGRGPAYDCWGLTRAVYQEMASLGLPSFSEAYTTTADKEELAALIGGEMGPWLEIPAGEERTLDAVLMTEARVPRHIGIVVKPGLLLHVSSAHESRIESYRAGVLRKRVQGFYRHRGTAAT